MRERERGGGEREGERGVGRQKIMRQRKPIRSERKRA